MGTTDEKPKRKRQAGPTPYVIARRNDDRSLAIVGEFPDLKTAHIAIKSGTITGEGLMLLAVRRVFKSVTVVQKPRTVIE